MLKTVEALHAQKNYEEALNLLNLNQAKISSGVWHYNMGVIYGKLQNYPMARFHFIKSEIAGFNSKELVHNKSYTESQLQISKYERPESIGDYLINASLLGTQGFFSLISLTLLVIGLLAIWKKKSVSFIGTILVLAFVVIGANSWVNSWKRIIILEKQEIQEGPSAIFSSSTEVPAGVVLLVQSRDEWWRVTYPSRFRGWLKKSGAKEL